VLGEQTVASVMRDFKKYTARQIIRHYQAKGNRGRWTTWSMRPIRSPGSSTRSGQSGTTRGTCIRPRSYGKRPSTFIATRANLGGSWPRVRRHMLGRARATMCWESQRRSPWMTYVRF
jgi:hypothetical protein